MRESLIQAGCSNHSVLDYFTAFRELVDLADWNVVAIRKYPPPLYNGFLLSNDNQHDPYYLCVYLTAICCKDLVYGGIVPHEQHQFEVYAPNHFSRQLGYTQMIPAPLIDSANHFTSWRLDMRLVGISSEISTPGIENRRLAIILTDHSPRTHADYFKWYDDLNREAFEKKTQNSSLSNSLVFCLLLPVLEKKMCCWRKLPLILPGVARN